MALSSRRSARRSITTAAVGLLTVGFVASCGAKTSQSVTANTSSSTTAVAAPTTTQPPPGGERLGCATYCQNAGGYGAAGNANPPPPAVTLDSTGTVTADADGYVPVTVTCNLPGQCAGVLILSLSADTGAVDNFGSPMPTNVGGGRSDLLVDAGATRTIGVQLDAAAIAFLRSHGPTTLGLTIDANQAPGTRGTASCGDWNEACKYFHNGGAPGDFSYLSGGELTVAAPG